MDNAEEKLSYNQEMDEIEHAIIRMQNLMSDRQEWVKKLEHVQCANTVEQVGEKSRECGIKKRKAE